MKTFVFWHPYLVFHLAPYIRELSLQKDFRVIVCAQEELPVSYRKRGYPIPAHGLAEVVISPSVLDILNFCSINDSYHVFLGLRAFPMVKKAYKISKRYGVHRFLMTENRDEPGPRSVLRRFIYKYDAIMENKHLDGIFCIGAEGEKGGRRFLTKSGYPAKKINPFRYVIEAPSDAELVHNSRGKEIIFVGQLIDRKGVDLLLRALHKLQNKSVRLTIIGSGEGEGRYLSLARHLGVSSAITWMGNIDNNEVRRLMSTCAALVLPSRFDGWGAVVNEALSCGCPVVCSDRCGAHELIVEGKNGFVFSIENPDGLYEALKLLVENGVQWSSETILKNSKSFGAESTMNLFLKGVGVTNNKMKKL